MPLHQPLSRLLAYLNRTWLDSSSSCPASAIVRQAEISGWGPNGLEAWPGFAATDPEPSAFLDNMTGFEEALSKWELTTSRWESSAHDALNEGVKIALLLKMTPEPLWQNLHLQGHTKYGVARAVVVNALLSHTLGRMLVSGWKLKRLGNSKDHNEDAG